MNMLIKRNIAGLIILLLVTIIVFPSYAEESRVHSGKKSLEFDVSATALTYHTLALEAGKTYTFSAWVMHPKTGAKVSMDTVHWTGRWTGEDEAALFVYGNIENQSGHLYWGAPLITDGTWQEVKATYTISQASGNPMEGERVSPGTSPYYAVGIDIRGAGKIYIDDVCFYDVTEPDVNLIEDGGFENAVVGPNKDYFEGQGWPGRNWVSNRWFPQYGYQTDGSGEISPFKIITVDTAVDPSSGSDSKSVSSFDSNNTSMSSSDASVGSADSPAGDLSSKSTSLQETSNQADSPDMSDLSDEQISSSLISKENTEKTLSPVAIILPVLIVLGAVAFVIFFSLKSKKDKEVDEEKG